MKAKEDTDLFMRKMHEGAFTYDEASQIWAVIDAAEEWADEAAADRTELTLYHQIHLYDAVTALQKARQG